MSLNLSHAIAVSLERPAGQAPPGHPELVDLLLEQHPADAPRPDLVVLAYAAADLSGHKTAASYLNMRTGGDAHSFALSGQGLGAPFTALRVAEAYHSVGQCSRPLIGIVECAPVDGQDAAAARADSAVLLAFDDRPGFEVRSPRARARGAGAPAEHEPDSGRTLVVLGPGADPALVPVGADVYRAGEESRCTGVWLALARHRRLWQERYATVVLAAADAESGSTHRVVLSGGAS